MATVTCRHCGRTLGVVVLGLIALYAIEHPREVIVYKYRDRPVQSRTEESRGNEWD